MSCPLREWIKWGGELANGEGRFQGVRRVRKPAPRAEAPYFGTCVTWEYSILTELIPSIFVWVFLFGEDA